MVAFVGCGAVRSNGVDDKRPPGAGLPADMVPIAELEEESRLGLLLPLSFPTFFFDTLFFDPPIVPRERSEG